MDYKVLAREVAVIAKNVYYRNKSAYDAYDSVKCAIAKYGVEIDKVSLGIAGDIDYKKLIRQIIIDLRFAKDMDIDYDRDLYYADCLMLSEITDYLEKQTDEFCMPGSTLICESCLNRTEYLEAIKEYGLI